MAVVYKVLAQSNPAATTATTLYTVPASTSTVVSTITVCNQGVIADTYRIAIRPAGATLATQHYIAYNAAIPAYDTISLTLGITLANTDVVTVYAGTANLSFGLFGSEIS
jgi:glucose-6-phosphate dehydrogenase assembly protein OpcA